MSLDHSDRDTLLAELRAAIAAGRAPAPACRQALTELDDVGVLRAAGRILAGATPDIDGLRPVRVAVQATCTVGVFEQLLRAALVGTGAQPGITVGDYGAFELALGTGAYGADGVPDVLACLLSDRYFVPAEWSATDVPGFVAHVEARLTRLRALVLASVHRDPVTLVLHTVPMPAEVRDGLVSWRARAQVGAAWHRMNAGLLDLAAEHRQVIVVDLAGLLTDLPAPARDDRLRRFADLPYTDHALAVLAQQVRRVVAARSGLSRRVLALDLDNTLWGGVLGEVGAEGVSLGGLYPGNCYLELQRAAARLREQGVILVLASKNDPEAAERALREHPEAVLRPEAFSAWAVNWDSKADNLGRVADALGLSTGSFVFLDDSAFERDQIRAALPDVAVVSAAGDPAHVLRSLLRCGWFDVLDLTEADVDRPQLYRARSQRVAEAAASTSTAKFLHTLDIEVSGASADGYTVPRAAQLAARTNQFNLTGERFDEAHTAAMAADPGEMVAVFAVRDRFGDEGIVGAAWVERTPGRWRARNLVLSCRVLGRGIELAVVEWIARQAAAAGATELLARYRPTDRNGAADGFLDKAGFGPAAGGWQALPLVGRAENLPDWIRLRDEER
jgi:FkbH-like protein